MPNRKTRARHHGSHKVAIVALFVAVLVSLGTVAALKSAGGPTPLEAAAIPNPASDSRPITHREQKFSGSGDSVIPLVLPDGADELAVASIISKGTGEFTVTGRNRDGRRTETLVDTSGRYSGTVAFNQARNSIDELRVVADGEWSITLIPARQVPEMLGGAASGFGDRVVVYRGAAGSASVTDDGPGHFHLTGFGRGGKVVIHEHGPFRDVVRWPAGPSLIAINSDGAWTIRVDAN